MNTKARYTIGIDFGTLSGRAILVSLSDGKEIGYTQFSYPHGVMDNSLPCGKKLDGSWALEHPDDYILVLKECIPPLLKKCGVSPEDVIGLGIDFTACTALPVTEDGTPLCNLDEYKSAPHAYVKLWKHHGGQYCADIINQKAVEQNCEFLKYCGGKMSSEACFPKLLQIAVEAPDIFEKSEYFIEAGDWLVWKLTGKLTRSRSMAGYKSMWTKDQGYPSEEFLESLKQGFGKKALSLLRGEVLPAGALAGVLTKEGAVLTGLCEGTAVSVCVIDAHSGLPASGMVEKEKMFLIMGTSGCHLILSDVFKDVPGILGVTDGGMIDGFYGYEAGQSGFGDHFEWFIKNAVSENIQKEASEKGVHILDLLSEKASALRPGESGLIALDWWNGNRSILSDSQLSGTIIGLTLNTKSEEIYRALCEAIAFGTRKIIENYEQNGIRTNEIYACGSMAKNDFIVQLFADISGKKIKIAASENGPALGAAIFGAVAARVMTLNEGAKLLGKVKEKVYIPNTQNKKIYDILYAEYEKLHDYFGKGENNVMKTLLSLKNSVFDC